MTIMLMLMLKRGSTWKNTEITWMPIPISKVNTSFSKHHHYLQYSCQQFSQTTLLPIVDGVVLCDVPMGRYGQESGLALIITCRLAISFGTIASLVNEATQFVWPMAQRVPGNVHELCEPRRKTMVILSGPLNAGAASLTSFQKRSSTVRFGEVRVREYERIPDSTVIFMGLSLGWEWFQEITQPIPTTDDQKRTEQTSKSNWFRDIIQ